MQDAVSQVSVNVPQCETKSENCPFGHSPAHRFPLPRTNPLDPPAEYAEIALDQPVRVVTQWNGSPAWFATRYADVRALLMDPRTSADATNPAYPAQNAALGMVRKNYQVFSQMDAPAHTTERRLFAGEFSVRRVALMHQQIQALVDSQIDQLLTKDSRADLVEDYAAPLPCNVMCKLIGAPEKDYEDIQKWAAVIASNKTTGEEAAKLIEEFCEGYLSDLVRSKDANPQDDMLSRLVVDHMRPGIITFKKVVSLARLLLTAGHESTTATIGMAFAVLFHNPDQLALLKQDPSLIGSAVEEILRYTDVTHSGRLRIAKEDIPIGNVVIRAGEPIILHNTTANRDPSVFVEPDRFDITRNARQHLAFGSGIHQCIGQPLARMELQLAINTLLARIPTIKLTIPAKDIKFNQATILHGVESLPVSWQR